MKVLRETRQVVVIVEQHYRFMILITNAEIIIQRSLMSIHIQFIGRIIVGTINAGYANALG